MKCVDFFFVGPSKTASTWIYKALDEHPEFSLPASKDVYFFDKFFEKGISWYHGQFRQCDSSKIIGEFSHDYILSEDALGRIRNYNCNAKLIVCIRNPFERTESGIKFLRRNGYGEGTVDELIERHTELVEGSLYAKNFKRIYSLFDPSNVLVLHYDTLKKEPLVFLEEIYQFFGVDSYQPDIAYKVVNKAAVARSKSLSLISKKVALLMRRLGLGGVVGRVKMNRFINRMLFEDGGNTAFKLSHKDKVLLSKYFNDDLRELSDILGLDFVEWIYE